MVGGIAATAAAVAAVAWFAGGGSARLRALVESPETGIRRALAAACAGPEPVPSSSLTLRLERLRFTDLLVADGGARAQVVAVADAEGTAGWRGHPIGLTYVGRERLTLVRCASGGWCVEGGRLPRLAGLLALLSRRADAFEDAAPERYRELVAEAYRGPEGGKEPLLRRVAFDLTAGPRARLRPLAWQIRIERDTAQVGEDFEVAVGAGPPRRLRGRIDLRDEGGRWRITGGL